MGLQQSCDELLVYTHKDSIFISTLDWGPVRTWDTQYSCCLNRKGLGRKRLWTWEKGGFDKDNVKCWKSQALLGKLAVEWAPWLEITNLGTQLGLFYGFMPQIINNVVCKFKIQGTNIKLCIFPLSQPAPEKPRVEPKKFVKIGRPGYRVTKQRDPSNGQQSLLFQVDYPGKWFLSFPLIPKNEFPKGNFPKNPKDTLSYGQNHVFTRIFFSLWES